MIGITTGTATTLTWTIPLPADASNKFLLPVIDFIAASAINSTGSAVDMSVSVMHANSAVTPWFIGRCSVPPSTTFGNSFYIPFTGGFPLWPASDTAAQVPWFLPVPAVDAAVSGTGIQANTKVSAAVSLGQVTIDTPTSAAINFGSVVIGGVTYNGVRAASADTELYTTPRVQLMCTGTASKTLVVGYHWERPATRINCNKE